MYVLSLTLSGLHAASSGRTRKREIKLRFEGTSPLCGSRPHVHAVMLSCENSTTWLPRVASVLSWARKTNDRLSPSPSDLSSTPALPPGSARACVDEHKTRRYRVVGGSLRGLVTPLFSAGVNCFVFVLECDRACSRICPRSSRKGARATRRW